MYASERDLNTNIIELKNGIPPDCIIGISEILRIGFTQE